MVASILMFLMGIEITKYLRLLIVSGFKGSSLQ
jgi:hypothetical protein